MSKIIKIQYIFLGLLIMLFGVIPVNAKWSGEMTPKTITITVGKTAKVTAKQTGNEIIKTLPTYTSSDPSIATVDNDGNVTGVKVGTATITGKYDNNHIAGTTTVTVEEEFIWSAEISPKSITISVGESTKVLAKQTGNLVINTLPTYISSDTSVATVDRNGNVKGLKEGTSFITAKWDDNHTVGTTVIHVREEYVWRGEMTPKTLNIAVGETGKVYAKQTGNLVVNTLPTYTSSNTSIATVDREGNVKGIKSGTVTITGKFGNNVAGTTTVTVREATVWSAIMSPQSVTINVGEKTKVEAKQTGNVIIKTLPTYTSSDPSIATVDSEGNVKGLKAGTVTITGKYDDSHVAGTTTVRVINKEQWNGYMEPTKLKIIVGHTAYVTAKQTGNVIIKTLPTYTSSDPSIATVDQYGKVTGKKAGVVTITGKFDDTHVAGTTTVEVLEYIVVETWEGVTVAERNTISVGDTTKVTLDQTGDVKLDSSVVYKSSDPSVATVDENGVVTALKPGKTTISARIGDKLVATGTSLTITDVSTKANNKIDKYIKIVVIALIIAVLIDIVLVVLKKKKQKVN